MEWYILLPLLIVILLVLLFAGFPIFIGFLILNLVGMYFLVGPAGSGMLINSIYETSTSSTFCTVALFILMGELLFRSGTVDVLFDSTDKLIGKLRGRLYIFTMVLSTIFGALSGSGVAVASMLGRSVLPSMIDRGYNRQIASSVILSGACLAPIIPPSLIVVVIGSLVDVSIAALLIAGIVPGLIFSGLTIIYVLLRIQHNPELAPIDIPAEPLSLKAILLAIAKMMPFGIIIFSVLGLILLGIATPSESAATGVVGTLLTAVLFRKLNWKMITEALSGSIKTVSILLLIIATSKLFTQILAISGASSGLVNVVSNLEWSKMAIYALMMIIPLFLCMFIDQFAFLLLVIPIYDPIITTLNFDPVWFWTIFSVNLVVGSITPPFGYTIFGLNASTDKLTTPEIYRSAFPMVIVYLVGIVILSIFPKLVLFLPNFLV